MFPIPTYMRQTAPPEAQINSPSQQRTNLDINASRYRNHIHHTHPPSRFRGCPRHMGIPGACFLSDNPGSLGPSNPIDRTMEDSRNPTVAAGVSDNNNSQGGFQGFPTRLRESATNILGSVARISSSIFQSGIDMAQTLLGDLDKKSREDVIKFNGFTIKVFGDALTLNSIHVNDKDDDDDDDDKKLSIKVKVGNEVNVKYAYPILGDNTWTLNFPAVDAFILIKAPLGVNSETISWECDKFLDESKRQRVLSVTVQ